MGWYGKLLKALILLVEVDEELAKEIERKLDSAKMIEARVKVYEKLGAQTVAELERDDMTRTRRVAEDLQTLRDYIEDFVRDIIIALAQYEQDRVTR